MSTVHDARLVPTACAAWISALIVTSGWDGGSGFFLTVSVVVAVAVMIAAAAMRSGPRIVAAATLPTTVAVVIALTAGAQLDRDSAQGEALTDAGATEAWIVITGQPAPMTALGGQPRHRAAATVVAWRPSCGESPPCAHWQAARTPVMVSLESAPARGDEVLVEASWSGSERPPATAIAWDARELGAAPPSVLVQWRARFLAATEAVGEESRGLLQGMVIGDTSGMPPSQVRDMRIAGLAHLTAVSGAHFAILIMATGAALSAWRVPRPVRAGAIFVVAMIFAALVGPEASVLRASGMAVAVALALAWGRPARGSAALTTTVIMLLVVEPALARSLGFTMSVLAVAAIVLWSPRVATALAGLVTPALARIMAIPIAAQVAVTPVLIVIDPHVSAYAVIANLAAGVAVLPTMLAGALALVISIVSVTAAEVAAQVAGAGASVIATIARAVASAPGSWLPWPAGVAGIVAALVMALMLIVAAMRIAARRRIAALLAAGVVAVVSVSVVQGGAAPAMDGWDVALCDVGQGDMMLVRSGPSDAVVIDTGPPDGGAAQCLQRHGVTRVPLLVLTHPHEDHDGAVVSVLGEADVETAWVSAEGAGGPAAATLNAAGVPVEVPARGQTVVEGRAAVTVVSDGHQGERFETNDASVTVLAVAGDTSVLALGDLEPPGQRALLELLPERFHVDVVKMAHHGSAQQWPELIELIDASVAIVSAGKDNRHGHPSPSALELYGAHSQAVLRTDLCGDVHVGTVDSALVWSQCPTGMAR